jgi:hypothetical protein
VFRNTYGEDFLTSLQSENKLTETFTKSYFQPYEKQEDKLIKDYDLEKKSIEKDNGFGFLDKMNGFRTDRTELKKANQSIAKTPEDEINKYFYYYGQKMEKYMI